MRRLMIKMAKKLHRQNGETLTEVLASILICTLSVAMLFTGIMASVRINEQAAQADEDFYKTLSAAEQKDGEVLRSGKVRVFKIVGGSNSGGIIYNVNYYGSNELKSYRYTSVDIYGGGITP